MLVKHINNIDRDVGWWRMSPTPQKKQDDMFTYLFPSTHSTFTVHVNMMNLFYVEMGWHKKHGNSYRINKDAVEIMRDEVDGHASFDAPVVHVGGVRNMCFIKIGHTTT